MLHGFSEISLTFFVVYIFQIIFKQVLQLSLFSVSNTSKMYMGFKHCSVAVLYKLFTHCIGS